MGVNGEKSAQRLRDREFQTLACTDTFCRPIVVLRKLGCLLNHGVHKRVIMQRIVMVESKLFHIGLDRKTNEGFQRGVSPTLVSLHTPLRYTELRR